MNQFKSNYMKPSVVISIFFLLISQVNFAQQTKLQQDQKAIKAMCGCFEVKFNFKETFNYASDSTYNHQKKNMILGWNGSHWLKINLKKLCCNIC